MAAYIAIQCKKKKDTQGLEEAQAFYTAIFEKELYRQFKEEVDNMLNLEGYSDISTNIMMAS